MLKKLGQYGGEKYIMELEREENPQKRQRAMKSSFVHSVSSNYQYLSICINALWSYRLPKQ